MERQRQRHNTAHGIFALWRGWAISTGTFVLLLLAALVASKVWLPVIAFALEIITFYFVRANRESREPVCYLLPFIATRGLFWTGVVMVAINLMFSTGFIYLFNSPDELNTDIRFITVLVIAPIMLVISAWVYIRRDKLRFCTECILTNGKGAERGLLGRLFTQEARYQVRLMLYMSIVITVVTWIYYLTAYININLNSPDFFFFTVFPIVYIGITWVYLGVRYFGLWTYYCQNAEFRQRYDEYRTTRIRYLIVKGNEIMLGEVDEVDNPEGWNGMIDTPVSIVETFREKLSVERARMMFQRYTDVEAVDVRYMYSDETLNADSNIFHYIATIHDDIDLEGSLLHGKWYSLKQVEDMFNNGELAPLLRAEIVRLWIVAMAWKSYTREGRRLYKIKNYRPAFSIKGVHEWQVDFNDREWINVYNNNEDRPLWRVKRWWRRHVNRMGQ